MSQSAKALGNVSPTQEALELTLHPPLQPLQLQELAANTAGLLPQRIPGSYSFLRLGINQRTTRSRKGGVGGIA
jgi:hypothetical protein